MRARNEFESPDELVDTVAAFFLDFSAGVLSGLVVGATAWLIARVPNITGTWTLHATTQSSAYNPYRKLEVTYIVMLTQHGSQIDGIAEKVYERRADGSRYEYVGVGRKRSEVSGGLRGNLFQRKKFHLMMRESGDRRDYASIHQFRKEHKDLLLGEFTSTAANSQGTTKWTRGIGAYNFEQV